MALAYGPQRNGVCTLGHAHALHALALEGMKVGLLARSKCAIVSPGMVRPQESSCATLQILSKGDGVEISILRGDACFTHTAQVPQGDGRHSLSLQLSLPISRVPIGAHPAHPSHPAGPKRSSVTQHMKPQTAHCRDALSIWRCALSLHLHRDKHCSTS